MLLPIDLLLSGPLNSFLHLNSTSFLFFEKSHCFFFSLSNLFVKDFLLSTLHISKSLSLSVNKSLSSGLFLLEFLFLSIFTKLIEGLSLLSVLFNTFYFFQLFLLLELLSLYKLVVCFFKVSSLLHLFLSSLHLSLSFSLELFFYLSTDEFSFQHFILHAFNAFQLKSM